MAQICYLNGDIFNSQAQVIVNTVNCKGVMGKGLALAFKQRYPDMFATYERDCQTGRLTIGRPTLYQKSTPWILNFPTKYHWRNPSKLEYIEKGLAFLVNHYKKAGIASIAFPKLGVQNGKLSWDDVGPLMAKYLSQMDIDVYIYIAEGDREYQHDPATELKITEHIWQAFSDLALSKERLQAEVGLSAAQAKKIAEQRVHGDFKSLADVEKIEKIAKVTIAKIDAFTQKYRMTELAGMPQKNNVVPDVKEIPEKPPKKLKKQSNLNTEIITTALFTF
jgi:O-acetyl-ADP-ribose deacetylase (regulator of RNase III)